MLQQANLENAKRPPAVGFHAKPKQAALTEEAALLKTKCLRLTWTTIPMT